MTRDSKYKVTDRLSPDEKAEMQLIELGHVARRSRYESEGRTSLHDQGLLELIAVDHLPKSGLSD